MPVTPTYPGVYVEEIPSGARTITGVATSITAFIGRAPKGPVNEPVLINNYGEYEQIFGGLWTESNLGFAVRDFYNNGGSQAAIVRLYNPPAQVDPPYTKTQLFVPISNATVTGGEVAEGNGTATVSGGTATLIRSIVTGSSATTEGGTGTATITGGTAEVIGVTVTATVNIGTVVAPSGAPGTVTIIGGDTFSVANSTITVSGGTVIGETITIGESKVTGSGTTATVTGGGGATVTGGTATVTGTDNTATVSSDEVEAGPLSETVSCGKVTGGTAAVIGGSVTGTTVTVTASKVTGSTATVTSSAVMTVIGIVEDVIGDATAGVSSGDRVTIETTSTVTGSTVKRVTTDGSQTATVTGGTATISGDTVTVRTDVLTLPMHMKLEAANEGKWGNKLEADVNHDFPTDDDTQAQVAEENLFNLSVKDNDTGVEEIFQNVSANSDHKRYVKNVLEKDSQLVRVYGDVPSDELPDILEGNWGYLKVLSIPAVDGDPLEATDFTEGESDKKGIYALENADLFNLLCIPPYNAEGNVDTDVINAAIIYCEKRRAMMIIDSPSGWANKKDAIEGIEIDVGSTSTNAAIFFPRLVMPNPLKDNQLEIFAPCGAVAGIFARTDATRGVWKAPAGLEAVLRGGVLALNVPLTDPENGELNPLGINCLRNKPPAGKIVWGSRTRVGDDRLASEWKYISVRRLALYLQESLYRGTQWAVFEPNDEPLWAQLRLSIGSFMDNLFKQGAFQGSSASDAYFVKCDKETTTQYDIDRGIVNIVIGFAPLKPAEFVILKFQQIAGQ